MTITTHRARRLSTFAASLGLLAGSLLVASPAQAAVGVDLSASSTTITEGQSVVLSWTSTDAVTLDASNAWTGSKTPVDAGSESVTPDDAGTFTYTLLATDENGREATDSVTVTVEAAAPDAITPAAVTFPDECTVVIPATDNVTYYVSYGDNDDEQLDAGTYEGLEFAAPGESVTFYAEANDGFELDDDAVVSWDYTASDSCFDLGPELVTTAITCGSVRFTNTTDGPLDIQFVTFDDGDFDELAQFTLAGGASRTVKTSASDTAFAAFVNIDEDDPLQVRYFDVPQNCAGGNGSGNGADHPTVAPAAGR